MSWIISDLELFSISLEIDWASWQGPAEKRLLVRPFYKQTLFFTDWQITINPSVKVQRAIKRKRWESLNVVCRAASGKERHFELRRDSGVCVCVAVLSEACETYFTQWPRKNDGWFQLFPHSGKWKVTQWSVRTVVEQQYLCCCKNKEKNKEKNRWQRVLGEKCYWGPDVKGSDFSDHELYVTTPRLSWSHKVNDWID